MPDNGNNSRQLRIYSRSISGNGATVLIHCKGCNEDFLDYDEYLEHVYDRDLCYKDHLASDRKGMGKE